MAELRALRSLPSHAAVISGDLPSAGRLPRSFFASSKPLLRRPVLLRSGGGGSWGSNAESVRRGRFRFSEQSSEEEEEGRWSGKGKWWSGDGEDDRDLSDEEPEQLWDSIWIFKVFKAYGYLLPAIVASLLLASGPKAFLMAMALPLGQSALSLAVNKLWGRTSSEEGRRRRPPPRPRKQPVNGAGAAGFRRKPAAGKSYADEGGGDYGGWGEVQTRRPAKAAAAPPPAPMKGKLSKRERGREVPLLLRLLIAIFPFLSSWTRIL